MESHRTAPQRGGRQREHRAERSQHPGRSAASVSGLLTLSRQCSPRQTLGCRGREGDSCALPVGSGDGPELDGGTPEPGAGWKGTKAAAVRLKTAVPAQVQGWKPGPLL